MTTVTPQEAAVFLSWLGEPVKQAVKSVFDDVNTATEAMDIFHKYRNAHFTSIRERWGFIKLLGMQAPRPLEELYEQLSVSTEIRRRIYDDAWVPIVESGQHPQHVTKPVRSRPMRATQFVEQNKRSVILAGPGAGKTTLLRFLALAQTDQLLLADSGLKRSRFPFFVQLRGCYEGNATDMPIEAHCKAALVDHTDPYASHFVDRVLRHGLAIVLLDGLDEVPGDKKKRVIEHIKGFAAKYRNAHIVLACRTADYDAVLESFAEAELQKLSSSAVGRLIDKWFQDQPTTVKALKDQLRTNEDIAALVRTPLYLSLVCIQFRHDLRLPHRRTEVYRRCTEVLLREWDASRNFRRQSAYEKLDDDRKLRLFEFLAGKYMEETPRYLFRKDGAEKHVGEFCELVGLTKEDGPGVLKEMESHHGIVEQYSAETFMFSHPSIQDYFAARHLISRRIEGPAVRKHLGDEPWASVIEFVLALHPDPGPLLEHIRDKSQMKGLQNYPPMGRRTQLLRMIYRSLCSRAAVSPDVRATLISHLVESQVQIAAVYRGGGVIPVAIRYAGGIRLIYLFSQIRRTLQVALRPLERLANEILVSPLEGYPELAIQRARGLVESIKKADLETAALATCLLAPVSTKGRPETLELLAGIRTRIDHTFFSQAIDHTLMSIPKQ